MVFGIKYWSWSYCDKKQGCKQTKCKTHIYWTTNTLFEFHASLSQWPPMFCLETNKEIAFFIIKRHEVSKGSNCFVFTFLSPLAFSQSLQTHTNPGPHWTSTGTLVPTYVRYCKSLSPHKSHDPVSLTPSFHLTRQKTRIQHIDFPQSLLQKSL